MQAIMAPRPIVVTVDFHTGQDTGSGAEVWIPVWQPLSVTMCAVPLNANIVDALAAVCGELYDPVAR